MCWGISRALLVACVLGVGELNEIITTGTSSATMGVADVSSNIILTGTLM
jgi:hypothetical protein